MSIMSIWGASKSHSHPHKPQQRGSLRWLLPLFLQRFILGGPVGPWFLPFRPSWYVPGEAYKQSDFSSPVISQEIIATGICLPRGLSPSLNIITQIHRVQSQRPFLQEARPEKRPHSCFPPPVRQGHRSATWAEASSSSVRNGHSSNMAYPTG